ncbi:SERTA domain-containing protein 2 [Suricata suricatta]|uniref:SERTA domain-containing protein 2 n=1 Tax=Suricata suricatta TaxID=37032 RepID=UPI0011556D55|nr:SERTA domain-containing protein 2 [Suricata suricatta]
MLGKGEKRKFDEHEDGLEGKILSPSDGPSKVSYTLQRQTIFNISLMKLYNHRPLTEPSLQKTVLINNMLRRIQEELKQEGSLRPVFASAAAAAAAAAASPPSGAPGGPKPEDPKLMDSLPGNFEITTSTGFLTDLTLDDILFADIDTSMYDFDPCTSASGTASKVAPVSADDLLKTLAPYSSQPVAPSQPFKMDLTELDHIMEVLVGS